MLHFIPFSRLPHTHTSMPTIPSHLTCLQCSIVSISFWLICWVQFKTLGNGLNFLYFIYIATVHLRSTREKVNKLLLKLIFGRSHFHFFAKFTPFLHFFQNISMVHSKVWLPPKTSHAFCKHIENTSACDDVFPHN